MLGDEFGQVINASLARTGDTDDEADQAGKIVALFMTKCRFELQMETIFDADVDPPGLMDEINLPDLDASARVLDVRIRWQQGGERGLSITAVFYDSLEAATLYTVGAGSIAIPPP